MGEEGPVQGRIQGWGGSDPRVDPARGQSGTRVVQMTGRAQSQRKSKDEPMTRGDTHCVSAEAVTFWCWVPPPLIPSLINP